MGFCKVAFTLFVIAAIKCLAIPAVVSTFVFYGKAKAESRGPGLSVKFFLKNVYGFTDERADAYVKSLDDLLADDDIKAKRLAIGAAETNRRVAETTQQVQKPKNVVKFHDVDVSEMLKPAIDLRRYPELRDLLKLPEMPLDFVALQRNKELVIKFLHPKRDKFLAQAVKELLRDVTISAKLNLHFTQFLPKPTPTVDPLSEPHTFLSLIFLVICFKFSQPLTFIPTTIYYDCCGLVESIVELYADDGSLMITDNGDGGTDLTACDVIDDIIVDVTLSDSPSDDVSNTAPEDTT